MDKKITTAFLWVLYRELLSIHSASVIADSPIEFQSKLSTALEFLNKAIQFLSSSDNA